MKIIDRKPLHKIGRGDKVYLTVWEITYEHKGQTRSYWSVGRGESYPEAKDKKPDAVVVVAILDNPGEERRLVCTSEFRTIMGGPQDSPPLFNLTKENAMQTQATMQVPDT